MMNNKIAKETTVDFRLDQGVGQGGPSVIYRPWGTRSLKIKVSTSKDMPALRIRPQHTRPKDAEAGTFRGFADDSDALMVTWGGGHEPGPCIKPKDYLVVFEKPAPLPAGEESYIYFNITHLDSHDPPPSATLTLEAYDPKTLKPEATLAVQLVRPDDLPGDVIRVNPMGSTYDCWQVSDGGHLPRYDPRWWPEAVAYEPVVSPPLAITRVDNQLRLLWNNRPDAIATITDNTNPSILDPKNIQENTNTVNFELFNFDEWHIALRIWFFWLNKKIGQTLIVVGRHEVPDAERFDLIIRKDSGQVILACTDLHWSEMWGELERAPLEAELGLNRKTIMEEAKKKVKGWLGIGKPKGDSEATAFYNPITFVRGLARTRCEQEYTGKVRAKGTEAHVPQLHGTIEYHPNPFTGRNQMVSNDVRLVFE